MKQRDLKMMVLVLIGVSFLGIPSVFAETAEEYFNHGSDCRKQGNITQAITDFTKCIEINSNYAGAYANRANAYYLKKIIAKPGMMCIRQNR